MITTIAILALADGITLKFVPSGAVAKAGGYTPIRCELNAMVPIDLKVPKGDTAKATFGKITIGSNNYMVMLDGATDKLYVDTNHNNDLTDDAPATWAKSTRNPGLMEGDFKLDIGKGEAVSFHAYKFDPNDQSRAALKNTLLYYGDYGYEATLTLDGKAYTSFIAGDPTAKTSFRVDRNNDGKISYKRETIIAGTPFNFTGTTYVVAFADGKFSLNKAEKPLPLADLPPDLSTGKKAISFTATGIDGAPVKFPENYKGKVVMLDFWATWCGPCVAELPNVKAAYEKHHADGFEILGISFDQVNQEAKVKDFTKAQNMPWQQIYEGKFWDTTLGGLYDVSAIPFCLLVDGDTGEILAVSKDMRGPGIVDTVQKALAKKKGGG